MWISPLHSDTRRPTRFGCSSRWATTGFALQCRSRRMRRGVLRACRTTGDPRGSPRPPGRSGHQLPRARWRNLGGARPVLVSQAGQPHRTLQPRARGGRASRAISRLAISSSSLGTSATFAENLELRLYVNDRLRQRSTTREMIWDVDELLAQTWARRSLAWEHHVRMVSLLEEAGLIPDRTLIMSGTPHGTVFRGIGYQQKISGFLAWLWGGWGELDSHPRHLGLYGRCTIRGSLPAARRSGRDSRGLSGGDSKRGHALTVHTRSIRRHSISSARH